MSTVARGILAPFLGSLLVFLLFLGLLSAAAAGDGDTAAASLKSTLYVATTGDDSSNDCTVSGSPCATIQHAVDQSLAGDEIRVAAGNYSGVQIYTPTDGITQTQVVYIDKELTVKGGYVTSDWETADPASNQTVIDAQGYGRPVTVIGSSWSQEVTLSGLTLTGGDYTGLGNPDGISTIHCNGHGYDCGGGLYVRVSAIHLLDCVVEDNAASQDTGEGGGIFLNDTGGGTIERTIVRGNASPNLGGGLSIHDLYVPLVISGSTFMDNVSDYGGGIFVRNGIQSLLTVRNTVFSANEATDGNGGALSVRLVRDGTAFIMDRGTLVDNRASGLGKALYIDGAGAYAAKANLSNLLLVGNGHVNGQATGPSDAVIAIAPGSPVEMTVELAHVTAASNTVDTFLYGKAAPRTVVWTTTVTATNILLSGFAYGFAAEEEQSGVTIVTDDHTLYHDVTTQTLIIAGSPSLTTLNPVSGDPKLAGDFHLTAGSVAIDAGLDIGVLVDLDGEARPNGSLPDIGADEFYWRYIYLPVIIR